VILAMLDRLASERLLAQVVSTVLASVTSFALAKLDGKAIYVLITLPSIATIFRPIAAVTDSVMPLAAPVTLAGVETPAVFLTTFLTRTKTKTVVLSWPQPSFYLRHS